MKNEVNLYGLIINVMTNTTDPNCFERYDESDRGVLIYVDDVWCKIIIETVDKKKYVRFKSITQELTKLGFDQLMEQWEVSKRNAETKKLSEDNEKDMLELDKIKEKYSNEK